MTVELSTSNYCFTPMSAGYPEGKHYRGFLSCHSHPLVAVFVDTHCIACLAILADVFSKLNNLNITLQ
ncbi:unnamed protein product, partial [Coregonus sp. 'balchen']